MSKISRQIDYCDRCGDETPIKSDALLISFKAQAHWLCISCVEDLQEFLKPIYDEGRNGDTTY